MRVLDEFRMTDSSMPLGLKMIRSERRLPEPKRSVVCGNSGVVNDGFERAVDGIEAEIRADVMTEYLQEWNHAGFLGRLLLRRKIERETKRRSAEKIKMISPESLF